MGDALLQIKIMPEQDTDLEQLKEKVKEKVSSVKGTLSKIEEQEIAFGLKALIATILWPEEQATDLAENAIRDTEGVSSIDTLDYRRAFG